MARIKLIVTGTMEELSLHESLKRFFPRQKDGEEVIWDLPRKLNGVTTYRLDPQKPPSQQMLALAQAMLDEVGIGKRGIPADLVLVVDDVELGNVGAEAIIVEHFRAAVHQKLASHSADAQARYRRLLQQNASFHLLKPMVESYLFGDSAALASAGVPAGVSARLMHPDVEQFETDDPAWLPTCQTVNARKRRVLSWWCHERHPKHYLEHLAERGSVFYEEVDHGRKALRGLDWSKVSVTPAHVAVIRCLFEDIADWFRMSSPLGAAPHADLWPLRSHHRGNLVLRNV